MATLVEAASEPELVPLGPITDEEAAAMVRAALNLFRLWDVTDEQAAVLLDLPRQTFERWKAGAPGSVGLDGRARLSHLVGTHRALRIAFSEPARGYAWIKAPNADFGGRSALDVMLGGKLADLARVRRTLDVECRGW